jgi:hypothetical protein
MTGSSPSPPAGVVAMLFTGDAPLREARLGSEVVEAARLRGRAVAPGLRVARACELGRAVVRA